METHSSPVLFLPHSTASPPLAETTAHSSSRSAPTQRLHMLQSMCVCVPYGVEGPSHGHFPLTDHTPHLL